MRRAFIGYSSPIGYDYGDAARDAQIDDNPAPNPILDSPFGLMLLFDELVFASKDLCPINMRNLPFVRILDELGAVDLSDVRWEDLNNFEKSEHARLAARVSGSEPYGKHHVDYKDAVRNAGFRWGMADNHSRSIRVGGFSAMGNPTFDKVAIDLIILERLRDESLELVGNSFLHQHTEDRDRLLGQVKLAETLVIDEIHSYQGILGPYHPVIDEARGDSYLTDFRRWVSKQKGSADVNELKDIKRDVEASLRRFQDDLFLKWLDPKGHAINFGKSLLLDGVGLLVPGVGTVASAVEESVRYRKSREWRWQGFLAKLRGRVRSDK